jgi:hypothetical protein
MAQTKFGVLDFKLLRRVLWLSAMCGLLFTALLAVATQYFFHEPFYISWARILRPNLEWQAGQHPSIATPLLFIHRALPSDPRSIYRPISGRSLDQLPIPPSLPLSEKSLRIINVYDTVTFSQAINTAIAGDEIILNDGVYQFDGQVVSAIAAGTLSNPIVVRSANRWKADLRFNAVEGIFVAGPNWIFKDIQITGTCGNDSDCEHAFHVVGNGRDVKIIGNKLIDFNAHIKVNIGLPERIFPDDGLVEGNIFFDSHARITDTPVTPINIDAANNWQVRNNVIVDFAKQGDQDKTSYGAFIKAAAVGGLFEGNIVVCQWTHTGGERIGLSFGGGGGKNPKICRDNACDFTVRSAVMRSNIVAFCPNDVGIYINNAPDSLVEDNILYRTRGIDVRFDNSTAVINNNVFDGRILARDGGTFKESNNDWSRWRSALLLNKTVAPKFVREAKH